MNTRLCDLQNHVDKIGNQNNSPEMISTLNNYLLLIFLKNQIFPIVLFINIFLKNTSINLCGTFSYILLILSY